MSCISSRLACYLIHYSPLVERLTTQLNSPLWNLLLPIVVDEYQASSEASFFPFHYHLLPSVKAEIMAQCTQIVHILSLHHKSLLSRNLDIHPACLYQIRLAKDPSVIREFYSQALSSYSPKNHELTLQHLKAMKLFLESGKDYCLILEDDSIPIHTNPLKFEKYMHECLDHVCILKDGLFDISNSFGFRPYMSSPSDFPSSCFIKMAPGQTRCASSYLVSRDAASLIINQSYPIVLPVDWHIGSILSRHSFRTFWYSHPMFSQGSQSGHFISNQVSRNS